MRDALADAGIEPTAFVYIEEGLAEASRMFERISYPSRRTASEDSYLIPKYPSSVVCIGSALWFVYGAVVLHPWCVGCYADGPEGP